MHQDLLVKFTQNTQNINTILLFVAIYNILHQTCFATKVRFFFNNHIDWCLRLRHFMNWLCQYKHGMKVWHDFLKVCMGLAAVHLTNFWSKSFFAMWYYCLKVCQNESRSHRRLAMSIIRTNAIWWSLFKCSTIIT